MAYPNKVTLADFYIKQSDNATITANLKDSSGFKNLAGATVVFQMQPQAGGALVVDEDATIVNAAQGKVSYDLSTTETGTSGFYKAQWKVTYSDGKVQSFPGYGHILIKIGEDVR